MRTSLGWMLAALAACSADSSASYLARDPCAALPITPIGATPVELDGITAAFALWHDRGVSAFDAAMPAPTPRAAAIPRPAIPDAAIPDGANRGVGNLRDTHPDGTPPGGPISDDATPSDAIADAGGPIAIRFDDAAETFHGVYDPPSATITINRALTDRATLAIVIAHELGHVFGLAHVAAATRASLMNPGNLATPPTDADQRTLEALWGTCGGAARDR